MQTTSSKSSRINAILERWIPERRHLAGILLPLMQLIAFWPVFNWYVSRITDGSDEPWGLVSLATLAVFLYQTNANEVSTTEMERRRPAGILIPILILYIALFPFAPDLLKACVAVSAIAITASTLITKRSFHAGIWGLAILSLPVIASLQFYVGYPLRVLVTQLAAPLLHAIGFAVTVEGTAFVWQGNFVGVDAACSGVKMLWTSSFLAFALSCFAGLNNRRTFVLATAAMLLAIIGNIFRAIFIFIVEVAPRILPQVYIPSWTHEAIGIWIFVLVSLGIAALSQLISRYATKEDAHREIKTVQEQRGKSSPLLYFALCAVAALMPLTQSAKIAAATSTVFPGWPTEFEGCQITQLKLEANELKFSSAFPGEIAKFTDGRRQIVMRWVRSETRQLHPSEDCFRGLGYNIEPISSIKDSQNILWGRFHASNGRTHITVRERIYDADGNNWTDVSAWYWAAIAHKTNGPWIAISVAEETAGNP